MPPPDKDNQPEDRSLVPRPKGELARAGEEVESGELVKRGLRDLEAAAEPQLLHTLQGHKSTVEDVAWSPDGTMLASCSFDDGIVNIWDAKNGKKLQSLGGNGYGKCVAWSPDGTKLAGGDKTFEGKSVLRIWEANGWKEICTIEGAHELLLLSVAWSPDGTKLASGSMGPYGRPRVDHSGRTLKLWDANTWRELPPLIGGHTFEGQGVSVHSVAWNSDGTKLASGGDLLKIWDVSSRRILKIWETSSRRELCCYNPVLNGECWGALQRVSWSPDGTKLAGDVIAKVGEDYVHMVRIWNAGLQELFTFSGHQECVQSLAWSPDGTRIASGSDDWTVRIFDSDQGAELYKIKVDRSLMFSVAWSPDGTKLAVGSGNRSVMIWSIPK